MNESMNDVKGVNDSLANDHTHSWFIWSEVEEVEEEKEVESGEPVFAVLLLLLALLLVVLLVILLLLLLLLLLPLFGVLLLEVDMLLLLLLVDKDETTGVAEPVLFLWDWGLPEGDETAGEVPNRAAAASWNVPSKHP